MSLRKQFYLIFAELTSKSRTIANDRERSGIIGISFRGGGQRPSGATRSILFNWFEADDLIIAISRADGYT